MRNFNFYINVDQCLNMSNFDMFFYKLQSERRFHLSNVQFDDEKGENSLEEAFFEIRRYMDKHPFLIGDYRLIFGIRKEGKEKEKWEDSVLYYLLKIHYGLIDARIFIRSKDQVDRNVSVIMLYDTDFCLDVPEIRENYDVTEDIILLFRYIGVQDISIVTEKEIYGQIKKLLEDRKIFEKMDSITRRFLGEVLEIYKEIDTDNSNLIEKGGRMEVSFEEARINEDTSQEKMQFLVEHSKKCISNYCVFQKEINQGNLSEYMLSLIGIVDYITFDLEEKNQKDRIIDNTTLRRLSEEKWKESNNDIAIHERYGKMIGIYKERLETAYMDMEKSSPKYLQGVSAPAYTPPKEIEMEREKIFGNIKAEEVYKKDFEKLLEYFLKKGWQRDNAMSNWNHVYEAMKEKLNRMDEELYLFARNLSEKYKLQIEERKNNRYYDGTKVYEQKDIEHKLEEQEFEKQKLLEKLKTPKLNPSLKLQDQLNLEDALEKCNLEVLYYIKCKEMVKLINFILLIFIGGGLICFHHLFMQAYMFSDEEVLGAFFMYIVFILIFDILCWSTPYYYFKKKIVHSVKYLQGKMCIFIRGYFEKAENFKEYINLTNELDSITSYMEQLEIYKKESMNNSRRFLWHKVQIEKHLRKISYFEDLIYAVDLNGEEKKSLDFELDIKRDVIYNKIYWPQIGGRKC